MHRLVPAALVALSVASPLAAQRPLNLDFEDVSSIEPRRPWGWSTSEQYGMDGARISLDSAARSGARSLRMDRPDGGDGFAWAGVMLPAEMAAGKRVRLRGWAATDSLEGGRAAVELWTVVDGGFVYDSTPGRGATGTTGWTRQEMEMDVPANVEAVVVGMRMTGRGRARFDGLQLEIDGRPVQAQPGPAPVGDEQVAWIRRNAIPLASVEPGTGLADLEPLRALVGDARIVSLGEATHGTHEFFQAKHRMTEFLVREMGFTVFALEANQLQTEQINRYVLTGEGNPRQALRGVFRVWQTEELLALVEWVRAWNASGRGRVEFVGYDMQNPELAIDSVNAFLARHDPAFAPVAAAAYAGQREAWRQGPYPSRADSVHARWQADAERVLRHVRQYAPSYAARAGADEVAWAVQNATVAHQSALLTAMSPMPQRDSAMAVNLDWALAQRPAGTRVIVWAHNSHVSRAPGWMGAYLQRTHPGREMVVLGLATHAGEYTATVAGADPRTRAYASVTAFPAPPGSVEDALHRAGHARMLLDLRGAAAEPAAAWMLEPRPWRDIGSLADDYGFNPSPVARHFDVLVYIDQTTASRLLPSQPAP